MSFEWPQEQLSNLVTIKGGKRLPAGKSLQQEPNSHPYIRVRDVGQRDLPRTGLEYVPDELFPPISRYIVQPNDIVLSIVGTIGALSIVDAKYNNASLTENCVKLHGLSPEDSLYLFYYLSSPVGQQEIHRGTVGAVQPKLPIYNIEKIAVTWPDRLVRAAIAEILGSIDDRITLLRETNTLLEQIAQTLFKSWFVDFDPVRAKQEGRMPEGMDEDTAALFPDSFEESELGMVPRGWKVGCVNDLARQQKGAINPLASPQTIFEHYSLPAFDAWQMPIIEVGAAIKSNKTPLPAEVVLLSKLNPHIPRVWLPVEHGSNAVCSTEFLAYSPSAESSKEFIYCLFSLYRLGLSGHGFATQAAFRMASA